MAEMALEKQNEEVPEIVEQKPSEEKVDDDSFEDFEEPKKEPTPPVEANRPSNGLTPDLFSMDFSAPVETPKEEEKPKEAVLNIDFTSSEPVNQEPVEFTASGLLGHFISGIKVDTKEPPKEQQVELPSPDPIQSPGIPEVKDLKTRVEEKILSVLGAGRAIPIVTDASSER